MPKQSECQLSRMKRFVRIYGDILSIQTDDKTKTQILYCQCCHCIVNSDQKSHVDQHLNTSTHRLKLKDYKTKQISVQKLFNNKTQNQFNEDLCEFMVSLNIHFYRISNPMAKGFFEKYTNFKTPDVSTLSKNGLDSLYVKTMDKIRESLSEEYIWLQIDETQDKMKRKIANVIVGTLNSESDNNLKYLLYMKFMDKTNNYTIVQCVNEALSVLWPNGIKYDKFLLLITDAAPYMKVAAKTLCDTYPKLTHITCIAHALHNVCEYLMSKYKDINRLVSCGKKVFKKAPNRIDLFRTMLPNTPLPPEPVKTRWGSWLEGVGYYAKYLNEFSEVINSLNSEESAFIEETKELLQKPNISNEIAFIFSTFNSISKALITLQKSTLSLNESLGILDNVYEQLKDSGNQSTEMVFQKLKFVLDKNKGLNRLRAICDILNGKTDINIRIELTPYEISLFKSCPITDCDIERSFSTYKWILTDRRMSFEEENLKKYLIINCFNH